ncbi:MAG: Brp/Blh family beta-carotene 15,15'-dioxygenase [Cyclobacteriaceae bacterium]
MSTLGKLTILLIAGVNAYFIDITSVNFAIAIILILFFGIPHGATDHVLFNVLKTGTLESTPKKAFIVFYLLTMILFALFWYFLPALSLLFFLIISAYHFGETQLSYWNKSHQLKSIAYLSWGVAVLCIILLSDIERLEYYLVGSLITEETLVFVASIKYYLIIVPIVIFFTLLLIYERKKVFQEIMDLAMIAILAWLSPLLLSFALFFAFWHSNDAILFQIQRLKTSSLSFSINQWVKLALPYSIISIVGIIIIVGSTYFFKIDTPLITLLFILIALITLPHSLIMSRFIQAKQT